MKLIENNQNVENLRKAGFKVRVSHSRYHVYTGDLHYRKFFETNPYLISPKGGTTTVEITSKDNKNYIGKSKCSKKDSFNRKLGLNIALGRLCEVIE